MPYPVEQKLNVKKSFERGHFPDIEDPLFWQVCTDAFPYTLLPLENMWALYDAVCYIHARGIEGDLMECGVFLGGALKLMADTLAALGDHTRKVYGYDTFTGFTRRSESDLTYDGTLICDYTTENFRHETESNIALSTNRKNIVLVEGDVTRTLLEPTTPSKLALIRLDTDSYDTTLFELQRLYPRLSTGGLVIVDDYGYCRGAKQAVDEYFSDPKSRVLFTRTNIHCRSAVKV